MEKMKPVINRIKLIQQSLTLFQVVSPVKIVKLYCYLKSRQAFARGLTGEEEEEEISEEEGVAASGSDASVDSDFESIFF